MQIVDEFCTRRVGFEASLLRPLDGRAYHSPRSADALHYGCLNRVQSSRRLERGAADKIAKLKEEMQRLLKTQMFGYA